MNAIAFAIIGALTFAVNSIFVRRAVIKVLDASVGVMVSVPISVPFFLLVLIATGRLGSITSFSWQSYAWLSGAGIIHFIIGRSLSYSCVKLVGANITNILDRVSPLISVILGISVLHEPLTWQLVVGVLLIFGGVTIAGVNPQMLRSGLGLFSNIPRKALLVGFGAGVAWGVSPIMIKVGLGSSGSPAAGAFISYSAATIVLSISLWNENRRHALLGITRRAAGFFCLAGLLSSTAQLFRYTALGLGPASVVSIFFSTSPVFVLVLSFLFNRKLEVFNKAIVTGIIAVVVGSILLA